MNHSITIAKTISILGCGWFGLELAKALIPLGYQVKGSSTSTEKLNLLAQYQIQPFLIKFEKDREIYDPLFFQSDILFVCLPPKRNTSEQAAFQGKIQRISEEAKKNQVKHLIFISSTAVYGNTNSEITELTEPQPETESGKAIVIAENLLKVQNNFTSTIIRFAGLVGPGRHPGRFFAGKTDLPNGLAPINLIHLTDCIGISLKIITDKLFGYTFNACSPDHLTKQEFYTAAALKLQMTPPAFKTELLNWKQISTVQHSLLNYKYLVNNWINWINEDNP